MQQAQLQDFQKSFQKEIQSRFALPSGDGCWLKQEHRVIVISAGQATETQIQVGRPSPSCADVPIGVDNLSCE